MGNTIVEEWRTFLYPLGFLSAFIFGIRFIIQWLQSEKAQKSLVSPLFWQLSLFGNILLMIHSFIQIQYHVCIVQACNGIISWRNLELMKQTKHRSSIKTVFLLFLTSTLLITFGFASQDWFFESQTNWFRIPKTPWAEATLDVSIFWHSLGTMGYLLFSSRFWIQWWQAEQSSLSTLPLSFWWLSLLGSLLCLTYFIRIGDTVNLIGPVLSFVPYIRNLMLIQKSKATLTEPV